MVLQDVERRPPILILGDDLAVDEGALDIVDHQEASRTGTTIEVVLVELDVGR